MEKIAQRHGLEGETIDCANLLNYGLDAYLKQLISSSVYLLRARTGKEDICTYKLMFGPL